MFVEEPLPPADVAGLIKLAQMTGVPLATGERLVAARNSPHSSMARAIEIAQPDICHVGGLAETKKIAAMAETAGIGVAPHNPSPIAGAAALHFAVSTPNFVIQEEMSGVVPWYGEVVQGPIKLVDGYWRIPETPGLGVEVDEAVALQHPYIQEPFATAAAIIDDGTTRRLVTRMRLAGKHAMITGAAQGIGLPSRSLRREGAALLLVDRDAAALEASVAGLRACDVPIRAVAPTSPMQQRSRRPYATPRPASGRSTRSSTMPASTSFAIP